MQFFGLTPTPTGTKAPVEYACSTVWDEWVSKPGFVAGDGTTYPDLTGGRTPDGPIYQYDVTLDSANAAARIPIVGVCTWFGLSSLWVRCP